MRIKLELLLVAIFMLSITSVYAQDKPETGTDSELLGLPGDNLDLYATLDLFQKSKTIEEFEASLNDEKTGINNLDLNLDEEVDFVKVVTQKEGDDYAFVLQVDVQEKETQDIAVILVTKDKEEKVTIQMVGDENLYGKEYVIEPKLAAPAVTANPAYSGPDTVVVKSEPATVVVIESEPIVVYMYSPLYAPYYPPYYYGYYPPYYHPYPVISVNIYYGRHSHYHHHYHGGYHGHHGGNTVVIRNNNSYNNYGKTRKTSNTVNRNKTQGNYNRNNVSTGAKPSANKNKPQAKSSIKQNKNAGSSTKQNKKPTTKPTSKPASKPAARPQKPASKPAGRPAGKPRGGGGRRR